MKKVPESKLPNQMCQQIFNNEFQIDVGNVSQQLVCRTIELYVQAMQFFANLIYQYSDFPRFDLTLTQRKHNFYQQKIKKLLSRNQVEKCLVGKRTDKRQMNFQQQLHKIHENAPQQAKLLIEYFKRHHKNQQKLINISLKEQQQKLNQRIRIRKRKRSLSIKKPSNSMENHQNKRFYKINAFLNEKLIAIF